LKYNSSDILSSATLSILKSYAFFDNIRILSYILYPVKKAIITLQSQSCSLANCFCELIHLGTAINKLTFNSNTFRNQYIAIFNKRYNEFDKTYWKHGVFRNLLLMANVLFKEMNKSDIARKELLYQMKLYCAREEPFDISYSDLENPTVWWFSLEDCFPKNEAYFLVQLALKLFSVISHTAGVEHGDKNFIKITEDSINDENDENEIFDEEDNLLISNILNLNKFCSNLDELEFSMDKEYIDEENYSEEIFGTTIVIRIVTTQREDKPKIKDSAVALSKVKGRISFSL
ncbi:7169_t:CDS:2, partial [Gigaspora rosea]